MHHRHEFSGDNFRAENHAWPISCSRLSAKIVLILLNSYRCTQATAQPRLFTLNWTPEKKSACAGWRGGDGTRKLVSRPGSRIPARARGGARARSPHAARSRCSGRTGSLYSRPSPGHAIFSPGSSSAPPVGSAPRPARSFSCSAIRAQSRGLRRAMAWSRARAVHFIARAQMTVDAISTR